MNCTDLWLWVSHHATGFGEWWGYPGWSSSAGVSNSGPQIPTHLKKHFQINPLNPWLKLLVSLKIIKWYSLWIPLPGKTGYIYRPRVRTPACLSPRQAATPEHPSAASLVDSYPTISLCPLNHLERERERERERTRERESAIDNPLTNNPRWVIQYKENAIALLVFWIGHVKYAHLSQIKWVSHQSHY